MNESNPESTPPSPPPAASREAPEARDRSSKPGAAPEETLDLRLERIDTEGVLKEGFAGQEM